MILFQYQLDGFRAVAIGRVDYIHLLQVAVYVVLNHYFLFEGCASGGSYIYDQLELGEVERAVCLEVELC